MALAKAGAGTWLVTGANTYSGGTTINAGTLTLAAGTVTTVNVQNGGTPLPGGDYKLVSVSGGGTVAGAAPTALTVTGDVTNTATLNLTGGGLYLHVPSSALTPPTHSGIAKSGSDVVLNFDGPSGQTYQVLTSTNVALPLASWTPVASGSFTGSPVIYTNTAGEPKRFFIITSP
jgi:autotransporter-associated beta strand protein